MGVPRIMPNWTVLVLKIETHGNLGIPHLKNPPYGDIGDHHAMFGGQDYRRKVSFLLHSVSTKTVLSSVSGHGGRSRVFHVDKSASWKVIV